MRPPPEARQTRVSELADQHRRPHHRRHLRGRVSGHRPVLPARRRRSPAHRLRWVMESSMLKTLAGKHRSTASKMARNHKATIDTPHGPRTCFEATVARSGSRKPLVARFGGIPLRRQNTAILTDRPPAPPIRRKELIDRLLNGRCELCAADPGHRGPPRPHALRPQPSPDDQPPGRRLMARRRRKTLVVCHTCHATIHPDTPPHPHAVVAGEPDARKRARPVRWEAAGKGPTGTSPAADPTRDRGPTTTTGSPRPGCPPTSSS